MHGAAEATTDTAVCVCVCVCVCVEGWGWGGGGGGYMMNNCMFTAMPSLINDHNQATS